MRTHQSQAHTPPARGCPRCTRRPGWRWLRRPLRLPPALPRGGTLTKRGHAPLGGAREGTGTPLPRASASPPLARAAICREGRLANTRPSLKSVVLLFHRRRGPGWGAAVKQSKPKKGRGKKPLAFSAGGCDPTDSMAGPGRGRPLPAWPGPTRHGAGGGGGGGLGGRDRALRLPSALE